MYAIVGISRLKPGATPEVVTSILERMRTAPGFVSGAVAWSTDGSMPADAPMEIESAEVCEVVAHAP